MVLIVARVAVSPRVPQLDVVARGRMSAEATQRGAVRVALGLAEVEGE